MAATKTPMIDTVKYTILMGDECKQCPTSTSEIEAPCYATGVEMNSEEVEAEKQQIINAIGAAIDALTQFEWYCDDGNPCNTIPVDIRDNLRAILNENKLLKHKDN